MFISLIKGMELTEKQRVPICVFSTNCPIKIVVGSYCNVDGQSGVFTVPCRAVPFRAGPGRGVLVATQSCGKHLSAALPWWRLNKS
jgi:hypothetical protein